MPWILPFFSNMYIHIDEVSEALHRYLVEKCKKNFSFALQVCMAASYFQHVCVLLLNLFTSVFFLLSLQCSKKAQYSLQRGKSIVLGDVRPCTFGWFVNSLTEPKTVYMWKPFLVINRLMVNVKASCQETALQNSFPFFLDE